MYEFSVKSRTKNHTFFAKSIAAAKRIAARGTGVRGKWFLLNGTTFQKGKDENNAVFLLIPKELREGILP